MSAVQGSQSVWSVKDNVDPKLEKCLNITEEIYKRINITFQIKKLETAGQSDLSEHSEQIDSNELSNETDLFACDKSSISSSTDAGKTVPPKFININNNEEKPKLPVTYKRPKKRFRKRVKKRQSKKQSDSEGSSDEALPLSRIIDIDIDKRASDRQESPDNVMGVPNITIIAKDLKSKIHQVKSSSKSDIDPPKTDKINQDAKETQKETSQKNEKSSTVEEKSTLSEVKPGWKYCTMCNMSFKGERGLRRHLTTSHLVEEERASTALLGNQE
ncbi:hypothetical protein ACJJTC_002739 [Scirpophaga incertulas]